MGLWQFIRKLNQDGHTIVLTTHYLEEAESLCGRIAMLKAGRVVALDTTANLLQRFATHTLKLRLAAPVSLPPPFSARIVSQEGTELVLGFDHYDDVGHLLAGLRAAGGEITDMALGKPDMEQVFVGIMNQN
jgi:ABC-2 type transport system ATP-binding protein